MNKLQLYISKSTREFNTLVDINGSEAIRRVITDMKPAVSIVDYPAASKNVFYAVTNVQGGYLVHVIRTIPPTRPYHLDAVIFIDKEIDILSEDINNIIEEVTATVMASAVTEADMRRLSALFDHEYDTKDRAPKIKASRGNEIAFLSYGEPSGRTLADVINDGLYRAEWSTYNSVLILDDSLQIIPNSAIDLDYDNEIEPDPEEEQLEESPEPAQAKRNGRTHRYVFALPMSTPDGKSVLEFEVECSRPIRHCPIVGYEINGKLHEGDEECNRLRRSHGQGIYGRFGRWLWGLGGITAGILIMLIAGSFKDSGSQHSEHISVAATQSDEPLQTKSVTATHSEATLYLDNNKVWRRNEMERIEGLQGLFDDLDNFRFEELTGHWTSDLAASKHFARISKAARNAMSKNVDPRREPEHNPRYNREGDNNISLVSYTYWIDP